MDISNMLTKQQGRKAMLDMLMQREAALPSHTESIWAHEFWNRRLDEYSEVKRLLGVGTATMSDHLRIYKDPFESNEPRFEFELLSLDVDSWPLRSQAVDIYSHRQKSVSELQFHDGTRGEFNDD